MEALGRGDVGRRQSEQAIGLGLLRWAEYAWAVLVGDGPAGAVRGAESKARRRHRQALEPWRVAWGSSPADYQSMAFIARIQLAAHHANALGGVLRHAGVNPATQVLLRVYSEACARALWIAADGEAPEEVMKRIVCAAVADTCRLPRTPQKDAIYGGSIEPTAQQLGLELERDRRGRYKASGVHWPDTRQLIERLAPSDDIRRGVGLLYSQQNEVVHSSVGGWGDAVALGSENWGLRALVNSLLVPLSMHERAQAHLETWFDWRPGGVLNWARRESLAGVFRALLVAHASMSEE